jgi:TolB-like protein/tetratricopeptide (TPR) repeat protein
MSGDSPLSGDDATHSSSPGDADHLPLSKDVFVSYASPDVAVANALVESLERHGIRCWIAPRDVTPGALYADCIIQAINEAKTLVLVLSASSIASKHVGKEVERASSKGRPIIPLKVDSAQLTTAFEYFLSESQWIDAGAGGMDDATARLVEAVRRHLDPSATVLGHLKQPINRPRGMATRARWIVAVGVAVLSVALAYFVIEEPWLPRHIAEQKSAAQPVTVAFTPPPHSIAVLPFVNMSGDASQEYFSDGVTEELLNSLSRLNELQVVARTSSFSFKGQNADISTIAHKLNVAAILEGSVRRAGNTVRVTVQLIDTRTGFHVWSQTYDRTLNDILKVQTDVATSVAHQLEVNLGGDEADKIELGSTKNPAAFDAYLRGTHLLLRGDTDEAGGRAAVMAFNQAVAMDPSYALAHAGHAAALANLAIFNAKPGERASLREQAKEAAEQAVALAPQLGQVHLVLAELDAFLLLDYAAAAPEFDRAMALSPGSAGVLEAFAGFSGQLGHVEAAVQSAQRAVRLDPQHVDAYIGLGQAFYYAHRYDEALATLQHADALVPHSHYIQALVTMAVFASGQTEQAQHLCETASTPLDDDFRHHCLAEVYHLLGRQADAERHLAELKAVNGDGSAYGYALIYAQWGNKAESLRWLNTAQRLHSPGLQSLRVDWELDPIRNTPEFKAIEARMNFPH